MFGNSPFYHQTTKRYVSCFGTLFNDIYITREDNDGNEVQRMVVPISYGPRQKFLARIQQDPNLTAPAITLPRMSFEMQGISYDGSRKLTNAQWNRKTLTSAVTGQVFSPVPYNIQFTLSIMAKYTEDGTKILEQILPFFTPDFTITAKLVDELDVVVDVAIVLNSVSVEDAYEASFQERRVMIWTLNFTLMGYYFGPTSNKKVIKFVKANIYTDTSSNTASEIITVQPGLTANGQPTTDINETIAYVDISEDDDWDYIVRITDA